MGYCGVIDERLDLELIDGAAEARPDWQFVMIGPVVKIDPATLPRRHNIHYLGGKNYKELPAYLSGWDVGLMPLRAMNRRALSVRLRPRISCRRKARRFHFDT
jgi:UDP-galactopyranose mutase